MLNSRRSAALAAAALCCLAFSAAAEEKKSEVALAAGEQAPKDHLRAQVFLPVDRLPAGGSCRFAVVLDVENGWHINANPAAFEFVKPTVVSVQAKHGTKAEKIDYPAGREQRVEGFDGPLRVYEGRVVLFGTLTVPKEAARQTEEVTVEVRFQACNDQQCVAPKTAKLVGKIPVAAPGETLKPMNEELFKADKKKDNRRRTT
jgi:DsbC/DsbD-like thiol-disulfide interchange protein